MSGVSLAVCVVVLAVSAAIVALTRPRSATTVDFYLAGQRIGVVANACAICGDYFSAASFLGVAAAVYLSGLDGTWYATGFAAGFIPVLLFLAAPLRRFGEFSLPDFLGARLRSEAVRLIAAVIVLLVILCYLVPQAIATGLTWELLVDRGIAGLTPYATGVTVATVTVTALVVVGGMRGTTWTQGLQFLFLLAVLGWLATTVVVGGFSYPGSIERLRTERLANPILTERGWELEPAANALDGGPAPNYAQPGGRYGPAGQFALVVTLVLGTAGLPHVMNRYFTSPSGRAARRTTVWVLGLAGVFYSLAVLLGVAARDLVPAAAAREPWLEGLTVEGILRIPEHALLVLSRLAAGDLGLGLIASGALVAVLSTIAGLLLAAAATLGHDVYERHVNPSATPGQAVRAGRLSVIAVAVVAMLPALVLRPETLLSRFPSLVAAMVTWAFALAGSALTPVLVLAVWWARTTAAGAVAGMVTGAGVAVAAVLGGLALGDQLTLPGLAEALLTPTLLAAPATVAVTVAVSLRTRVPEGLDELMRRLHGAAADREAERLATLTIRGVTSLPRSDANADCDTPAPRWRLLR